MAPARATDLLIAAAQAAGSNGGGAASGNREDLLLISVSGLEEPYPSSSRSEASDAPTLPMSGLLQKTFTLLGKHTEAFFEYRKTQIQRHEESHTDYEKKNIRQFGG